MENFVLFVRMARPLFLVGGVLLYALGAGVAHYLGTNINWGIYLLGQAWVTVLQLGTQFLNEYYNAPEDVDNKNRTPFSGGSGALGPGKLPRRIAMVGGLTCLTVVASLTVLMLAENVLSPLVLLIMVLIFLGAFFYSTPPVALERSGYGELTASVLVAFLVPAFAFSLQSGDLHRLIAMATFPLVMLHMAMLLSFEFPDYANDLKHQKRTLLVRLGWRSGITIHNIFILGGFLLLLLAASFNLPLFVLLPALLPIPLAVLQVWQLARIANGGKPNWNALTINGIAVFASTAYLITFSFWTH
jgi:1,4-dihydroxy-2-naphthoate octaprenyltransferase